MESFFFVSLKVALILLLLLHCVAAHGRYGVGEQPLSKIAIHRALFALHDNASIKAEPALLGTKVTHSLYLSLTSSFFSRIKLLVEC
jgi:hypothetical protein